jgi:hypothetical protein
VSIDFIDFLLVILIPIVTPSTCEVLIDCTDFFFFCFIPILTPATTMYLIVVSRCSCSVLVLFPTLLVGFPIGFIEAEGVQVVEVVVDVVVLFVLLPALLVGFPVVFVEADGVLGVEFVAVVLILFVFSTNAIDTAVPGGV